MSLPSLLRWLPLPVCAQISTTIECCACRPAVVFVAFVIDLAFSLCLAGFLIMHGRLIAANMTTIEMWVSVCLLALSELGINPACMMYWNVCAPWCRYEKGYTSGSSWPFDQGISNNFQEVFGPNKWQWLLPRRSRQESADILQQALHSRPPEHDLHGWGSAQNTASFDLNV